jgi:hypothetical protein
LTIYSYHEYFDSRATPQYNPRSDGVLWIISSEYGLEHLMDDAVNSTGVDMHEATLHAVAMHEA